MRTTIAFAIISLLLSHHRCRAGNILKCDPDTVHMNIDTTGARGQLYDYNLNSLYIMLQLDNDGKDTLRLPPNTPHEMMPELLPPGASGTLFLYKKQGSPLQAWCAPAQGARRQEEVVLLSGQKTMTAGVWLDITFGRSQRIRIEEPVRFLDSQVAQGYRKALETIPDLPYDNFSLNYKEQLHIHNLTGDTYLVPQEGIAFNDWGGRLSYREGRNRNPVLLKARHTMTLPVSLEMDRKKQFHAGGYLIMHTPDDRYIDIVFTGFSSSYRPPEDGSFHIRKP